tara:strand:- start:94 stop:486 length:393 start_codon:yes stop_codon:yes gene_type:complete
MIKLIIIPLFLLISFIPYHGIAQDYSTEEFKFLTISNKAGETIKKKVLSVFKYNKDISPDIEIFIDGNTQKINLNRFSDSFSGERDGVPYKAIIMKGGDGKLYTLCGFNDGDILMIDMETKMELLFNNSP